MNMTATYRIRRSLEGCHFKLSLGLCLFEGGYCLDLFGFLIPRSKGKRTDNANGNKGNAAG